MYPHLFLCFELSIEYLTALQGAARMVLHGGTHPAQLKDAVTSTK